MIPDRAENPKVRRGDRIRVTNWGSGEVANRYGGLEGTVRSVSNQGVVVVDLDRDPLYWQKSIVKLGLIFDPAFKGDTFEVVGRGHADD